MLDAIAPVGDEMVLPKTSSSVFISTNIDYVLRNLGVRSLMIRGPPLTRPMHRLGGAGCVRSGCTWLTVPTDACATLSAERHEWALRNNRGVYCRQITTLDELVREIDGLAG